MPDTLATSNKGESHGGSDGNNAAEGDSTVKGLAGSRHKHTDGKSSGLGKIHHPINASSSSGE